MYPLLAYLHGHAHIGMVTGNPRIVGELLVDSAGLSSLFDMDTIIFGDEFPHDSRARAIADCVYKNELLFEKTFDTIVYIGDTSKDIQAGKESQQFTNKPTYTIGLLYSKYVDKDEMQTANANLLLNDCNDLENTIQQILDTIQ